MTIRISLAMLYIHKHRLQIMTLLDKNYYNDIKISSRRLLKLAPRPMNEQFFSGCRYIITLDGILMTYYAVVAQSQLDKSAIAVNSMYTL